MTTATHVVTAVVFVWIGMIIGISFIEAPLKFRAPGVTLPIGLGIGRLVFRALNATESVFAVAVVIALAFSPADTVASTLLGAAIVALIAQVIVVRPRLSRRTDAILAGEQAPRSWAHHAYIGLELVKLVALVAGGIAVMS